MKKLLLLLILFHTSLIYPQDIYSDLNYKKKQWVDSIYSSLSLEEKIAQWFNDLERTPHYPYLDKIVTDEDVEKLCEVVEKMFDK